MFKKSQVVLINIKSDNFYFFLTDVLRDLEKKDFYEVWQGYSTRYESLLAKINPPVEYENSFEKQIRTVFELFNKIEQRSDLLELPMMVAFASEIIRNMGSKGGPLIFENKKYNISDPIQIEYSRSKKTGIKAEGKVIGIRWEKKSNEFSKSLILEISHNNYIDVPLDSITSVKNL